AQSAKVLDEAIAARSTFETEHRAVRLDGTVRWTHGWARPRLDHQGAVSGFVGVVADIADRASPTTNGSVFWPTPWRPAPRPTSPAAMPSGPPP
ncbi:MAG: PAS domain-containing protein, partial [Acidimicrobiales bacterium]